VNAQPNLGQQPPYATSCQGI